MPTNGYTQPYYPERRNKPQHADYAWLRSREHRHRQAHYYDMDHSWDMARSMCGRVEVWLRDLTHYKEYVEQPNNACYSCVMWVRTYLMREIAV